MASFIVLFSSCQSAHVKSEINFQSTEFVNEFSHDDRIRWLNERWNYLRSFYQVVEEPYFGVSENDVSCESRSIEEVADLSDEHFIGKSVQVRTNAAGMLGICRQEDQTHVIRILFITCKNSSKQFDVKRICHRGLCQIDPNQLRQLCKAERIN